MKMNRERGTSTTILSRISWFAVEWAVQAMLAMALLGMVVCLLLYGVSAERTQPSKGITTVQDYHQDEQRASDGGRLPGAPPSP